MELLKIVTLTTLLALSPSVILADNTNTNNGNNGNNGNSPLFVASEFGGGAFALSGTLGFAITEGSTDNGTGFSGVRNTSGATQFSGVQLGFADTATGSGNNTTWTNTLTADTASFGTNYSTTYVEQLGTSTTGWGSSAGGNLGVASGWGTYGSFNSN